MCGISGHRQVAASRKSNAPQHSPAPRSSVLPNPYLPSIRSFLRSRSATRIQHLRGSNYTIDYSRTAIMGLWIGNLRNSPLDIANDLEVSTIHTRFHETNAFSVSFSLQLRWPISPKSPVSRAMVLPMAYLHASSSSMRSTVTFSSRTHSCLQAMHILQLRSPFWRSLVMGG